MALETGTYVDSLVSANPASTDGLAQADDHIRLIKSTIKNTFPNITGPVTSTQSELDASLPAGHVSYLADLVNTGVTSTEYGYLDNVTSNIQTQIDTIVAGSSNIPQSNIDYLALITGAGVSSTQFGYLSSTTSDIQAQFTSVTGAATALASRVTTLEGSTAGDITAVTAGSGMTGGGTSGAVTITHDDTSSQASVSNSGNTVIQSITLDTFGHVTGVTSATPGATYTQPTALGAVGTYALLYDTGNSQLLAGSTRGGSNLRYANALSDSNETTWYGAAPTGTVSAPTSGGTWRCMGTLGYAKELSTNYAYVRGSMTSVFLRIS